MISLPAEPTDKALFPAAEEAQYITWEQDFAGDEQRAPAGERQIQ